jgi:hypothetical protein
MWYHANGLAQEPANDAPAQLTEMTIRDPFLATMPTGPDIAKSEKTVLVNYDVSYVDSILLPVAMEAADVPLDPLNPSSRRKAYGWIGASQTVDQMQRKLKDFTSENKAENKLGLYFGGKGYDKYYSPNDTATGTKLPAGQNLIGDSSLRNVRSSYSNNQYALASGGVGPVEIVGGNGGFPDGTTVLKLVPSSKLKDLLPGMVVTLGSGQPTGPTVPPGTTIVPDGIIKKNGDVIAVKLSQAIPSKQGKDFVFQFMRPVTDYVASKLTNLWYGWADYYVAKSRVPTVPNVSGTTTLGSNVVSFTAAVSGLEPGMTVTSSAGVLAPNVKTTILAVAASNTSVTLSTLPVSPGRHSFTFSSPEAIPRSAEVQPLSLSFAEGDGRTTKNYRFSEVVYAVMSAMSTIPAIANQGSRSTQLMFNVLGGNVGFIPAIGNAPANAPPNTGNPVISNVIRDDIKSIMRGVVDFKNPATLGAWYPDPAVASAGAKVNSNAADFSVYNLNPFVWFVHKQLGLSGYGFSLDDDVADVGANGATKLAISVGGLGGPDNGLSNKAQWSWGAPFGPVESATGRTMKDSKSLTDLTADAVAQVHGADPSNSLLGALVTGPGIAPGTTIDKIGGTTVFLTKPATATASASTQNPYKFSAPPTN